MSLIVTAETTLLDLLSATTNDAVQIRGEERPLGFTNKRNIISPERMALAKYTPIGSISGNLTQSIILYQTVYGRDAGFALFNEDLEVCFPLDINGVLELIAPDGGNSLDEQVLLRALIEAAQRMILP